MTPTATRITLLALVAATALAACDRGGDGKRPGETSAQLAKSDHVPKEVGGIAGATPMEQRVAVLGLLNKRNGLVREIEMKPGESVRIGRAIVRLRACETTAPWEDPPETGAFVQLFVEERATTDQPLAWHKVFSGWLFRNSPSLNVVEHPVYDVWVKDCAMSFPGEEEPVDSERSAAKPAGRPSTAASPAPTASPSPTASASARAPAISSDE